MVVPAAIVLGFRRLFFGQEGRVIILAVDTRNASWAAQAESAIKALRDVEGVSIQIEGDEVREIHVLSRSKRPPKQIVRDVQTVLLARYGKSIDYRVVSVAFTRGDEAPAAAPSPRVMESLPPVPPPAPPTLSAASATPLSPPAESMPPISIPYLNPGPHVNLAPNPAPPSAPLSASQPARRGAADAEFESAGTERIRFGSVNLFVSGPRTQAQVELRWKGLARMGGATGWSTRDGAQRLVAQATLAAVQEFLEGEVAFGQPDVDFLRMGRKRLVVVALSLLAHRQEKLLVGTCAVEQDVPQAVVLATLAALNRIMGGLPTRVPTEYVLRPTST